MQPIIGGGSMIKDFWTEEDFDDLEIDDKWIDNAVLSLKTETSSSKVVTEI